MNVIFVGLSSVSLLLRFSPIPLLTHIPLWPPGCRGVEEDRYVRSLWKSCGKSKEVICLLTLMSSLRTSSRDQICWTFLAH